MPSDTGIPLEAWVGVPVFVVALLVMAIASLRAPVQARVRVPAQALEEALRKGPSSYFHHIFDPNKLLGLAGQSDLDVDAFECETSHGVLSAALPRLPRAAHSRRLLSRSARVRYTSHSEGRSASPPGPAVACFPPHADGALPSPGRRSGEGRKNRACGHG